MKSLTQYITESKKKFVCDMTKEEQISLAQKRYKELCKKFNNKDFSKELCEKVGGHNFEEEDFFDLNYKEICATISNVDGKCKVTGGIELYDDAPNSNRLWTFNLDGKYYQEVTFLK